MSVALGFAMILVVSCASLVGVFFLSLNEETLDKILFVLIAFGTGTIFASALLDLIPEAIHHLEELIEEGRDIKENTVFIYIIYGFIVFFILERFLYWFHGHGHSKDGEGDLELHGNTRKDIDYCEENKPKIKNFAILNLVGDGLHNFLDGVIIIVAFMTEDHLGWAVTIAVLMHELPQEIGDFGILIYGGFSKKKALLANLGSALIAFLGGLFAYLMSESVESFNMFFLAFSGGGFIYLSCSELLPEMMEEKDIKKSIIQTFIFILGIVVVYLLIESLAHAH